MEEHGFEVVNVYPNSPAARAGMVARTGSTAEGDLGALGSVLLLPIAPITFPLLRKSGALGTGGDLIIAVDDVRVRTPEEIRYALGHLKPGDTTYITVIRPLAGGYHRTMRIALHIDHETDAAGNILPFSEPRLARRLRWQQKAPRTELRRSARCMRSIIDRLTEPRSDGARLHWNLGMELPRVARQLFSSRSFHRSSGSPSTRPGLTRSK